MKVIGDHIDINTTGKTLVLPTSNAAILPSFNQSVLDPNRLTIAESPFGGLKGSGSPDYAPGTLNVISGDGIYLQDINGQNSTKTLTAGKLKELNLLTVDTVNHAITEEFIVANTVESNSPTVIDSCDATTGWSIQDGTGTISVESGRLKLDGTTSTYGRHTIHASRALNLSSYDFITCEIECTQNCNINLGLQSGSYYLVWRHYSFTIPANTRTKFVLPLRAPAGTTGTLPIQRDASFSLSTISRIIIGVGGCVNSSANTIYIDNITADVARPAYIELQNPDNLSDSSLQLQVFDGSAYQTTGTYKLDSTYSAVGTPTSANWKLSDGTKFDDCYGSGNGRALFPKGSSEETKTGSTGTITYSANKGTQKRIGIRVLLPPSDGGRTSFNKIRIKSILSYTDVVGNKVLDLSGNGNNGTIVGGVTKLNEGGLQFDGSTGYVTVPHNNNLDFSGTGFSIICKVKTSTDTDGAILSKKAGLYSSYNPGFVLLKDSATGLRITLANGVNLSSVYLDRNSVATNEIIHFVVNVDFLTHTTYRYKNGVKGTVMSFDSSINSVNNTQPLNFGTITGETWGPFDGSIIELKVYNRILSQNEATASYNSQSIDSSGLVLHYTPTISNMGATTYEFSPDTDTSTGLQNVINPWIALYDPATSEIDFYLFTHRPKNLTFKRNESGQIHELTLYPGNGLLYHGQITYSDLTRDTDSNDIPDCLEASLEGSLSKFLQSYGMVI